MTHHTVVAELAAERRQRFVAEAAADRTAAAVRQLPTRASRTTSLTSLLRRRLKQLPSPRAGAATRTSYDSTVGRTS
jgi:hypothetical protein